MISRRKLLGTAGAAGAASLFLNTVGGEAAAVPSVTPARQATTGFLSITQSIGSSFDDLLSAHFPGLSTDVNFHKVRPYAALITNVSGVDINAFSTYWEVDTPGGGYDMALRHFFHPSEKRARTVHFGTQGNQTRFTGALPAIKAGATRLLTPYFCLSVGSYQKASKLDWNRISKSGAQAQFTLQELSSAMAVRVSIDAVIVNQSQVIGNDRASLAQTYQIMRNAEHDAAVAVVNMMPVCPDPNASTITSNMSQIQGYLEASGYKYTPLPGDDFHNRLYRKVRQRQATILARRLRHATAEQFSRTLQFLIAQPQTRISRTSLT